MSKTHYSQLLDHHMHTTLSPDGRQSFDDIAQDTIARGKELVVTTDHMELFYLNKGNFFCVDMDEYAKEFAAIQAKYPQLTFMRGMELGYESAAAGQIQQFIDDQQLAVAIISIHTLFDGKDLADEIAKDGYWKYSNDLFDDVLNATIDALEKLHGFQTLGHLDYCWRYMKKKPKSLEPYYPKLDKIFQLLIEKEISLDINTAGWRYGLPFAHPQPAILERYYAVGGRMVTLGSDAHFTKDINADFERALKMLAEIGFDYITEFRPQMTKVFLTDIDY
ncbi:histidinol-phosphatase HisJ family protein [Culicoidibacter larvae]|uniref:Histidinol-phosphatase n=1 Tax=Culicoidibacter larvae TaxID=2579976 RepID=A0A5R8QB59_9FIRM|nr:histidinol-phosphatase HisJ family protein [Culicoidibacter larvae]TLG72130.1 histidinol-phosphatase HisJ family protein [Culicoidibacter larvae]